MSPITVAADKRFLRAGHVRPVRRHVAWRLVVRAIVRLAIASVVAFGLYHAARAVIMSPALQIEHISVRGTDRLSKGEVLALVEGLRRQNIFAADLEQARWRLVTSPWVADAVLHKRLPSSVDIVIRERRPMGIARLGAQLFLMDDEGRVIDEFGPKYAELDLPIIDGLARPGQTRIDAKRAVLASRVVSALAAHPETARRVSQIDVSDASDAVVLLDTDSALLRLGDRDFLDRLEAYFDLAPRLREQAPDIDYVDLRYGTQVFVGTAGGKR